METTPPAEPLDQAPCPADTSVEADPRPENASEQQPASTAGPTSLPKADPADDPEVRRLIDEAEQRGYLRGRNDNIDELISTRFAASSPFSDDDPIESCPSFLAHIRPGFWD